METALMDDALVKINPEDLVIEPIGGPAKLVEFAKSIVIQTDDDYQLVSQIFVKSGEKKKGIELRCRPNIKRWDDGHKAALKEMKDESAPFSVVEVLLAPKMTTWEQEQDRLRKAEELRQQEAQRKQDEDLRVAEAIEAEAAGEDVRAEEILSAPPPAPIPVNLPKAAASPGVAYQTYYSCDEVFNLMALAKAVVAKKVPLAAIQGNMKTLNAQADALKDEFEQRFPGCRLKKERKPKRTGR